ncbi:MAG TPA: V-type ATP synthase subunit E family protein [Wenzhouxiangella sp.]|nr:V-type ATP synthase subunit E family protein [Wenzhouxiangella sp.]
MVKEIQESYKERFKKEKPEILNRREIVAGLDVDKIKLGAKQSLIQDAFDEALKKMSSLPKDKYLKFVESLLDKAVETGKEEMLIGKSEKNITKSWLDSYNQKHDYNLTFSDKKLPVSGGFVLKNDDIETNCSFEMLLSWHREELEADVVKRLFSA